MPENMIKEVRNVNTKVYSRLAGMKLEDLQDAAVCMRMEKFGADAGPEELAKLLTAWMEEHGENLQLMLTCKETVALMKGLEQGCVLHVETHEEDSDALLRALQKLAKVGLAECTGQWQVDERVAGWLHQDDKAKLRLYDRIVHYMEGMLLHVGMMPLDELSARAARALGALIGGTQDSAERLCRDLYLGRDGLCGVTDEQPDQMWAIHREVAEPSALLKHLQKPEIAALSYPEYPAVYLIRAGEQMHLPGMPEAYKPLLAALRERGVKDKAAVLKQFVFLLENECVSEAADTIVQTLYPERKEDREQFGNMLKQFSYRLSRWYNKGYTPLQMRELMKTGIQAE